MASRTITLISSDGETFDLEERESQMIKHIIQYRKTECGIRLWNVTSKILAKVIEYCKKHVETPEAEEHAVNDELKGWAADFFKDDRATFFDLIKAANSLRIKSLLDLTCQTLSDMTQEMSGNEICEIYLLIKERSLQKICKIYDIETKLTLQSSDGEFFYVDVAVAMESQTIKHMIEDRCADNAIPLPNVTSKILARVIEYCKKHVETPKAEEHAVNDELRAWDADFVKVDQATLFDLILAADHLRIESLLDLARQTVVDMTKEMSLAEKCEICVSMKEKSLDNAILPNVTSKTLAMVIEYCKKHVETSEAEEHAVNDELKGWAADYFKDDRATFKDGCADNAIPLPNVTSRILAKVIEYCKKHVETPKAEEHAVNDELKAWDADFVKVDQATLIDLINAANYLDIKSLLDLTCQTVADMIKEMSGNEICEIYLLIKERSLQKICKIYNIETKLTLQSSDGKFFCVDVAVAMESQTIKHMIEDGCADHAIPVPNVTSQILTKVIEYCKKHVETPRAEEHAVNDELRAWDADFVKVDQATVFDLILAANYLNIKSLLDLTCQTVASMLVKGKTPKEIRNTFVIKNDFTPEEEEEVRFENPWAFGSDDERDDEWVFE